MPEVIEAGLKQLVRHSVMYTNMHEKDGDKSVVCIKSSQKIETRTILYNIRTSQARTAKDLAMYVEVLGLTRNGIQVLTVTRLVSKGVRVCKRYWEPEFHVSSGLGS